MKVNRRVAVRRVVYTTSRITFVHIFVHATALKWSLKSTHFLILYPLFFTRTETAVNPLIKKN